MVLVYALADVITGQLVHVPGRPDDTTMEECGLVAGEPYGESAREVSYMRRSA